MGTMVPSVEASDHIDGTRIGSPNAEAGAVLAVDLEPVGAHLVIDTVVAAFVEKVHIFGGEQSDVIADGGSLGNVGIHEGSRFQNKCTALKVRSSKGEGRRKFDGRGE